jgi:hypothetical protein
MSYLKYANACAEIVRGALKEPHLSKVKISARAFLFLYSLSKHAKIDHFFPSRMLTRSLSLCISLSPFNRLERGTRCTLSRRNT